MKTWQRIILGIVLAAVLIAAGAAGFWYFTRPAASSVPEDVRSQLTFSPLVIADGTKDYTVSDYKFSIAEGKVQILSFLIHIGSGSVSVSEYVQPNEFTDIPEYKSKFLSNVINQYATVQSSNGTIYLGRAAKQNNKQLAIMIERGLLVFLSPEKELSDAQWRQLGDHLELQKID